MIGLYKKDKKNITGFTIVELLIVIVIIGVLAALVIVAYNGIQNRSYDTVAQSDLRQFASKIKEQEAITGAVPTVLNASMGIKFTKSVFRTDRNNLYYCVNTSTGVFIIYGQTKSNNGFLYRSDTGLQASADMGGYAVCQAIGLGASTWPQATAHNFTAPSTSVWSAWVND